MALQPDNAMWQRILAEIVPRCAWLPIDAAVCDCTTDLTARLRRTGRTLDWADLFIAATSPVHGKVAVNAQCAAIRSHRRVVGRKLISGRIAKADGIEDESFFRDSDASTATARTGVGRHDG